MAGGTAERTRPLLWQFSQCDSPFGMLNPHAASYADALLGEDWDVAVVGSGMGGATLARELAEKGHRVLLLEKGRRISGPPAAIDASSAEERLRGGWWPLPVSVQHADGSIARFHAPVGCAVGGSTIHYAAALERMAASDFDALSTQSGGVEAWPVKYSEFELYYEAAEHLHGLDANYRTQALPRLSEWNRELMTHMQARGMDPDVLHTALRYDDDCRECVTQICPRRCKADALSVSLDRAASLPNFRLFEECDVQRIEADASRVTGLVASFQGKQIRIRARMVVLAAGALHTPQLLLRSANEAWPDGVANRSGLVGRNLMFHTVDVLALWAPHRLRREGRQRKALSIRDFYVRDGVRLGYIQSMGLDADRGLIAVYMKQALRRRGIRNELLLKLLVALPARIAAAVADSAEIFAAMSEDDPSPENRLTLDPNEPDGASIQYTITDDLRQRATRLREEFARSIAPWRLVRTSMSLDMNYGHACGTCRFGNDPATSVLDRDCRAHDLDNLYVVDASFMPRSGAVNPSLTIAANAIRVAAAMSARLSGV